MHNFKTCVNRKNKVSIIIPLYKRLIVPLYKRLSSNSLYHLGHHTLRVIQNGGTWEGGRREHFVLWINGPLASEDAYLRRPQVQVLAFSHTEKSTKIINWDVCSLWLACTLRPFSRLRLFVTVWTVAHLAPLSVGFSRQEYWSGLPFSPLGGSSWPRVQTQVSCVSCIAGRFFTTEPPGKPL